jgi:hypothetical protein
MGRPNQYPIRDAFTPSGSGPSLPLHDHSRVPRHVARRTVPAYLTTLAQRLALRRKGAT